MESRTGFRRRVPLEARPGRRAVVAPDLGRLCGPTSGVVELPHRLLWHPNRQVDLDNAALLAWVYETVLCEAASVSELEDWLDGATLIRLWPTIFVPRGVREAWEQHHPVLRAATVVP